MNVRPFEPEDESAVIALWQSCDLLRPWNDPHKDIRFCRESGHGEILVGEESGRIVASVLVGHDGHRGWLYYLAVSADRRKQGLGREIVSAAEQWLEERGAPKAELMIRTENFDAAEFYRRIGYRQEARTVMGRRLDGVPQPLEPVPETNQRLPLIETTITYLEMHSQPETPAIHAPPTKLALLRAERPACAFISIFTMRWDATGPG